MNVLLNKHHGKRFDMQTLHRQLSCINDSSVRRNVTYRQNASKSHIHIQKMIILMFMK